MKQKIFLIGLLTVALSMVMTGCGDSGENANIEGTWQGTNSAGVLGRVIFGGNTCTEFTSSDGINWTSVVKGTFTSTGNTITATATHYYVLGMWMTPAELGVSSSSTTTKYTISGNKLTGSNSSGTFTLTKQ
ncbi:hypothetical protein FACS1894164_13730 [Spirochaetia bacterium]|nr:hypothetical protein FACS1894164_13730 [Spirochaetia bacterium]